MTDTSPIEEEKKTGGSEEIPRSGLLDLAADQDTKKQETANTTVDAGCNSEAVPCGSREKYATEAMFDYVMDFIKSTEKYKDTNIEEAMNSHSKNSKQQDATTAENKVLNNELDGSSLLPEQDNLSTRFNEETLDDCENVSIEKIALSSKCEEIDSAKPSLSLNIDEKVANAEDFKPVEVKGNTEDLNNSDAMNITFSRDLLLTPCNMSTPKSNSIAQETIPVDESSPGKSSVASEDMLEIVCESGSDICDVEIEKIEKRKEESTVEIDSSGTQSKVTLTTDIPIDCDNPKLKEKDASGNQEDDSEIALLNELDLGNSKAFINCVWSSEPEGTTTEVISAPAALLEEKSEKPADVQSAEVQKTLTSSVLKSALVQVKSKPLKISLKPAKSKSDENSRLSSKAQADSSSNSANVKDQNGVTKKKLSNKKGASITASKAKLPPQMQPKLIPIQSSGRVSVDDNNAVQFYKFDEKLGNLVEHAVHSGNQSKDAAYLIERVVNSSNSEVFKGSSTAMREIALADESATKLKNIKVVKDPTLLSAYKDFIIHPPVPTYSPENCYVKFFSGHFHHCNACNDKFVLPTSLQQHMARRTILIHYNCRVCGLWIVFFNRCTLLEHNLNHGIKRFDIDLTCISMGPLPLDQWADCSPVKEETCYECPECLKNVTNMEEHMEGKDNPESQIPLYRCKQCNRLWPSACSLTAHHRIHKKSPPFVCPECGKQLAHWKELTDHLKISCLYSYRKTVFSCLLCQVQYASTNNLESHLYAHHMTQVFKCAACDLGCRTALHLKLHKESVHNVIVPDEDASLANDVFYACQFCPKLLIPSSSCERHLKHHSSDLKVWRNVFKCINCKVQLKTKDHMKDHIRSGLCPASKQENNFAPKAGANSNLPEKKELIKVVRSSDEIINNVEGNKPLICNLCHANLTDKTDSRDPLDSYCLPCKNVLNSSGKKQMCNREKKTVKAATVFPNSDGEFFKNTMSNEINGTKVLDNYMDLDDSTIAQTDSCVALCKICNQTIPNVQEKAAVRNHFQEHHREIFLQAMQQKNPTAKKPLKSNGFKTSPRKRKLEDSEKMALLKVRKSPAKKPKVKLRADEKNSQCSNGSDKNLCYYCAFTTEDTKLYQEHMLTHKTNSTDLQCPLCYAIVRPPIEKHLQAKHRIKNVTKFLKDRELEEQTASDELNEKVQSEEEPLEENQCKVCREKFETAFLLDKHFRVHGGAFLLAKRLERKL